MNEPIFHIDAFADGPFTGNPAAVVLLGEPRDAAWMQSLASEMNLSETAFVEAGRDDWHIRWFTPAIEVDLCGHATLAAGHALWESGKVPVARAIRFQSRSGILRSFRDGPLAWLDFPAAPVAALGEGEARARLLEALTLREEEVVFAGKNGMDAFVQVRQSGDVNGFTPAPARIAALPHRGVILTAEAPADAPYHFISRFFAPGAGVDEDPVTGSAHCALGPFWSKLLGESALTGYQASPRGGIVETRTEGARVFLGGKAVTIFQGTLT